MQFRPTATGGQSPANQPVTPATVAAATRAEPSRGPAADAGWGTPGRGAGQTLRLPQLPEAGPRRAPAPRPVPAGAGVDPVELADELAGMAASIGEVDPRSAERMEELARAIGSEEGRQRWSDVDLRRAFHTERLAHVYAVRREGGYASGAIDLADKIRNILVLLPIFLTWFAFAEASRAFAEWVARNPERADTSMLVAWENGFDGLASPLAPTFSTVALIDAGIIAVIILLTFYSHGRRETRDAKIEQTANAFQSDLDNVLAEATVVLAGDRGSRPAMLARGVERLADRFDRSSQELLNRLRVEHDRLEQIAARREREFADFGVFASGMRAGAEETHRLLIDLRQVSTGLSHALEDLTSEVSVTTDQQRTLLSAVQSLERLTTSGIQSDQAVTRQIGNAASALADAADKALAGSEAAAQAGRVATEAVKSIADLARGLGESQARVEAAVAAEAEANGRLAEALRSSTTGVSASTHLLSEIGDNLAELRDDLGRLARQTGDQASALNALLDEQSSIAGGLSQVARDLSSISIVTAQRQQEVNKDVATLVGRLDGLTNILARAASAAPTADTLERAFAAALRTELAHQAEQIAGALEARAGGAPAGDTGPRRDPGRLWPQRRT